MNSKSGHFIIGALVLAFGVSGCFSPFRPVHIYEPRQAHSEQEPTEIPLDPHNAAWIAETCPSGAFTHRPKDRQMTSRGVVFLKIQCMTKEQAEQFEPGRFGLVTRYVALLPTEIQETLKLDLEEPEQ